MQSLTTKQTRFVKNISKGYNKQDSAKLAGYSNKSSGSIASGLLKKKGIIQALNNAGLTDKALATNLATGISSGLGVKATNSDSLRGIEIATKLKGYQTADTTPNELTQTNIYIQELKQLDTKGLVAKLDSLNQELQTLKAKS